MPLSRTMSVTNFLVPNDKSKRSVLVRWALALGIVTAIILTTALSSEIKIAIAEILKWISSLGPWGIFALWLVHVTAVVLLVPTTLFNLAAGYSFGVWVGFPAILVSSLTGACIAFALGRGLARDCVRNNFIKHSRHLWQFDTILLHGGGWAAWRFVFISRVPAFMPNPILNYLYGTTGVPFLTYASATLCGFLPGTFLYVCLGHTLHSLGELLAQGSALYTLQSQAVVVSGITFAFLIAVYLVAEVCSLQNLPLDTRSEWSANPNGDEEEGVALKDMTDADQDDSWGSDVRQLMNGAEAFSPWYNPPTTHGVDFDQVGGAIPWHRLIIVVVVGLFFMLLHASTNMEQMLSSSSWLAVILSTVDALLHTSSGSVFALSVLCVAFRSRSELRTTKDHKAQRKWYHGTLQQSLIVTLVFAALSLVNSQLQIVLPSWAWNPLMWGSYTIYDPAHIERALEGVCTDGSGPNLCLSERSWRTLSSGTLSTHNVDDVKAVMDGVWYAKTESGGMLVNVLARDTIDAIPPLRNNIEGLAPFFPGKLSVVVYENDSTDGTREEFKKWASEAKGYEVDLIDCSDEGDADCKLAHQHRYDVWGAGSKAVGKMARYRNRMTKYVVESPKYKAYSHMLTIDLDIAVSLSPLGILHTLGKVPTNPVASSGRQVWPGSWGSIIPPYDFSAFRAIRTEANQQILDLHKDFCNLGPEGGRWHNVCDAASPIQLGIILYLDRINTQPYKVISAFHGATLYPLDAVRETKAEYDSGSDGQRCEHIGFNVALKRPFYVNPKWNMHLVPYRPGGPSGWRALMMLLETTKHMEITAIIVVQHIFFHLLFTTIFMLFAAKVLWPLATTLTSVMFAKNLSLKLNWGSTTFHLSRSELEESHEKKDSFGADGESQPHDL